MRCAPQQGIELRLLRNCGCVFNFEPLSFFTNTFSCDCTVSLLCNVILFLRILNPLQEVNFTVAAVTLTVFFCFFFILEQLVTLDHKSSTLDLLLLRVRLFFVEAISTLIATHSLFKIVENEVRIPLPNAHSHKVGNIGLARIFD